MRIPMLVSLTCGLVATSACSAQRAPDSGAPLEQATFAAARRSVGADSFVIDFPGLPKGFHRFRFEAARGGYRYTEQYWITPEFNRSYSIDFDSALTVLHVSGAGADEGKSTGQDVAYSPGKALGRAAVVQKGEVHELAIDKTLPNGAFPGSALLALLPALDWRTGHAYALTMFDVDEQNVTTQTLRVVGAENVQVPAGEFAALKGELTTTQLPVTVWVTASEPHRLLKLSSGNGATVLVH